MGQGMKILITGGCSFSECRSSHIDTWPRHLARALPDHTHISTGMGSQGNGLISRRIIHQVTEQLKHTSADKLLVGIIWSGPDRHDYFTEESIEFDLDDWWMENPTKFVPDSSGAWVILNLGWKIPQSKLYYTTYHSSIGHYVYTCEHVLRTQWFLKAHNIKYFMSTYTAEVFTDVVKTHPETKYLYDQIDLSNFLPVVGEYEWCRDHSNLEFPVKEDFHPSSDQHQAFTNRVIVPFLQDKKYI
jgi:hypothetical protein